MAALPDFSKRPERHPDIILQIMREARPVPFTDLIAHGLKFSLDRFTDAQLESFFSLIKTKRHIEILSIILEQTPMDDSNRDMFRYFLNKNNGTSKESPLFLAVSYRNENAVKLLLEHGADPNISIDLDNPNTGSAGGVVESKSDFLPQVPMDYAGDNLEIFKLLKSAGAIVTNQEVFNSMLKYPVFLFIHTGLSNIELLQEASKLPHADVLSDLVDDKHIDLWAPPQPLVYRFITDQSVSVLCLIYFWNKYKEHFPFSPVFEYNRSTARPMLSQRGKDQSFGTCAPDVLFTILFEQPEISSKLMTFDPSAIVIDPSLKDSEKVMLYNFQMAFMYAKERYSRMMVRRNLPLKPALRREASMPNNLGAKTLHLLQSCSSPGLTDQEEFDFLDNLLVKNIFKIPSFESKPFSLFKFVQGRNISSEDPDLSRVIAINLGINYYPSGAHALGFLKKGEDWFFLDNNVGFLHKVNDPFWVTSVLLPRIVQTIKMEKSATLENPEKCVFLRIDPSIEDIYHLHHQFITLGDRFYPNIDPGAQVFQKLESLGHVNGCILYVENPVSSAGGRRRTCLRRRKNRRLTRRRV